MPTPPVRSLRLPGFAAGLLLAAAVVDAAPPREQPAREVRSSSADEVRPAPAFAVQSLFVDANEGCSVADFDADGDLDISAGRVWLENPGIVSQDGSSAWTVRPLRAIDDWNGYLRSNGEHAIDVDEDGDADIVSGDFLGTEVFWFENPGPEALRLGQQWTPHLLGDTGLSKNEMTIVRDLDGDGRLEWVVNSWDQTAPLVAWTIVTGERPSLRKRLIGSAGNGHGIAFGDINNDGRDDILVGGGWYERPAGDVWAGEWAWHADWPGGHYSCPAVVRDFDRDGRSDLLFAAAHDYGLTLWTAADANTGRDGPLAFDPTPLDPTIAQLHTLLEVDLDGDGVDDIVSGRRFRAHNGKDPGAGDLLRYVLYRWDGETMRRDSLAEGVGAGLQIRAADLDGDGDVDLVSAGKDGTEILWNIGTNPAAAIR